MSKYRFIRCRPHKKVDTQGWYLILSEEMGIGYCRDLVDKLHNSISNFYYFKFGMDPHLKDKPFYNPIALAAKWFESVISALVNSETLAMNSCGGWFPLGDTEILEEVWSDELRWPDRYPDEVITISRWPDGQHFYLTSNQDRLFSLSKFNTVAAAEREAKKYTDKIKEKL